MIYRNRLTASKILDSETPDVFSILWYFFSNRWKVPVSLLFWLACNKWVTLKAQDENPQIYHNIFLVSFCRVRNGQDAAPISINNANRDWNWVAGP